GNNLDRRPTCTISLPRHRSAAPRNRSYRYYRVRTVHRGGLGARLSVSTLVLPQRLLAHRYPSDSSNQGGIERLVRRVQRPCATTSRLRHRFSVCHHRIYTGCKAVIGLLRCPHWQAATRTSMLLSSRLYQRQLAHPGMAQQRRCPCTDANRICTTMTVEVRSFCRRRTP